MLLDFSKN
jgi:hypothetical protein